MKVYVNENNLEKHVESSVHTTTRENTRSIFLKHNIKDQEGGKEDFFKLRVRKLAFTDYCVSENQ